MFPFIILEFMITTLCPQPGELTEKEIQQAYQIMIEAYANTESELWGKNYVRMSQEAFKAIIDRGELIVARNDHGIVGSIRVYEEAPHIFNFSVFSVAKELRGEGIGRALVLAAEEHARNHGGKIMTLEILRPQLFEMPAKTVLTSWYKGMGYQYKCSALFEERKPHEIAKSKELIIPAVFDCYEKAL